MFRDWKQYNSISCLIGAVFYGLKLESIDEHGSEFVPYTFLKEIVTNCTDYVNRERIYEKLQ